jgi:hypothetical protein
MNKYAVAVVAAFAFTTGTAMAQSTTLAPAPSAVVAPPPGTLSVTETKKTDDGFGDKTVSEKTTYGNASGAVANTATTTTRQPPPQVMVTTKVKIKTTAPQ